MDAKNSPVDVIALCSAEGQIKPLRLRMTDEQACQMRVDIDEVVSVRTVTYVGVEAHVFLCRATVLGQEWLFELKYLIRSHSWRMVGRIQ